MADIATRQTDINGAYTRKAPYGNDTGRLFTLQTNASGVIVGGSRLTAFAIGDVAICGKLYAGAMNLGCTLVVSDAFTAATTIKFGFRYVDGVDSAAVPQDDDAFMTATSIASVLRQSCNTTVAVVTLPKDAYLIATNAGANHAAAGKMDFIMDMVMRGEALRSE